MSTTSSKEFTELEAAQPANTLAPNDLLQVLQTIWKGRKTIVLLVAVALGIAVVASLLLPNYYKAETRFLALSPDQLAPETLFGTTGLKPQVYGNMNDIDRLLAIAESNDLIDYLVDTFALYTHYDIDPNKPKAAVTVRQKLLSFYEVTKTPKDAILLAVEDKNPQMAADLANAARARIDYLNKKIIQDAQSQNSQTLMQEIAAKESKMSWFSDSLKILRARYRIFDLETQKEVLSTEMASLDQKLASTAARLEVYKRRSGRGIQDSIAKLDAQLQGLQQAKVVLDSQLIQLNEGMVPVENLNISRIELGRNLNKDTERLQQIEATLRSAQPTLALLEAAQVPVIKSRPRRSLIVLGSGFAAAFFAVLLVLLAASSRQYNWQKIFE